MATLEIHNNYMFTPICVKERLRQTVGQCSASWIISPAAATPEEVEAGKVLHERYLVPYVITPSQYKARLLKQDQGVPVPPIRGFPVVLNVRELASEEDNAFRR